MYKFTNANQALIGMSHEIIKEGRWRDVRGYRCLEIPHPVLIEITNPTDRYINIEERKWNKYLPFVESLWIALGMNDLEALPARYIKSVYDYSDDGRTWRAGYGPRIRAYNGISSDYNIADPRYRHIWSGFIGVVDQLKYVVDALQRDPYTRQAIITLGDPVKDDYDTHNTLKVTKDYPCTRSIQFMRVDEKLNCTVYIRSNDIMFGFSAVNIFNFTWMQEYVANILDVPIGRYYHVANNLHVYDKHYDKIERFASLYNELDRWATHDVFQYRDRFGTLINFDRLLKRLFNYEQRVYHGDDTPIEFENDMMNDWARVFLHHHDQTKVIEFVNPYLNKLFYEDVIQS